MNPLHLAKDSRLPQATRRLGISRRLRALAERVPFGTRLFVDVGTNHAILPVAVLREGRAERCLGIDRSHAALADGQRRLVRGHCEDRVELCNGQGLVGVTRWAEVDAICIAGLGPHVMRSILAQAMAELIQHRPRLILNPFGSSAQVRELLDEHRLHLLEDSKVVDRGREYELLVARSAVDA